MAGEKGGHGHERVYEEVLKRLRRAEGHVRGVERMWEEGKSCPEILLQIGAVEAALKQISRIIVEEHMESCLARAGTKGGRDEALAELKEALKQLL
ncbi:MAG: metal-sensitive transcriptional regulator [Armatimonadota bacterium]|nr:metal-sensitive transcriptional regulator [Armatimonadota bacterium]